MKYHWIEELIRRIEERKEPYTITSGITTSGEPHLGTLCEVLFPWEIYKSLKKRGRKARFIFIGDILDAFDSIPYSLKEHEEFLSQHLGKPLCNVPLPFTEKSYGEYFLEKAVELFTRFGIDVEVKKANELYQQGVFDKYTITFYKNREKVKKILEETSGRKIDGYPFIQPICEKCGKIATTTVIDFDDETGNYTYICNKDVGYTKGCGYEGKGNIYEHKYKLAWRLHWPSWQDYFNTTIEGGGVDHFTRGGSYDTAVRIHKEILRREPPIGFKYGFILFEGKKFSKSKGIGISLQEILNLMPEEVIEFWLLKYDREENINVKGSPEFFLSHIEDYEKCEEIERKVKAGEEIARYEEKLLLAYQFVKKREWKGRFRDYLVLYQIYGKRLDISEEDKRIARYAKYWVEKDFLPQNLRFKYQPKKAQGIVREFFERLKEGMDDLAIHNFVYEFAKEKGVPAKDIFRDIYLTLIGKERGPRVGRFIYLLGIEKVKRDVL